MLFHTTDNAHERMRKQYAKFCARGRSRFNKHRHYLQGREDYDALCAVPGVICVGVNRLERKLFVGIECIDVPDSNGRLREIGEFIITVSQQPPEFFVENITRTVDGHPHPHVSGCGTLCISTSKTELRCMMLDCQYASLISVVIHALRMDRRYVHLFNQYDSATLGKWPLKEVL